MRSLSQVQPRKVHQLRSLTSTIFLSIMCNALIAEEQTPMFDASLEIGKCDPRRTRANLDGFRTTDAVGVHSYGRAALRSTTFLGISASKAPTDPDNAIGFAARFSNASRPF